MKMDTYPPMKMEQTDCSETSAYKVETPGNYPEENIQHVEHGENLKSRILHLYGEETARHKRSAFYHLIIINVELFTC